MKPFTKVASVFFGFFALVHLYRFINPFKVVIGNFDVPTWVSPELALIAIIVSIKLWMESKK